MKYSILPTLRDPRLALRPIREDDLDAWHAYLSQALVYGPTSWPLLTRNELAPYVDNARFDRDPAANFRFAIVLRASDGGDSLIGTLGFHTIQLQNRSAEITYDLSPDYWGQGIASSIVADTVAWAHEHCKLLRVQATTLETNQRSRRVLERTGFVCEGLLRCYRMVRGEPGNFWMYSHLPE